MFFKQHQLWQQQWHVSHVSQTPMEQQLDVCVSIQYIVCNVHKVIFNSLSFGFGNSMSAMSA
jgi:hypothetical protein